MVIKHQVLTVQKTLVASLTAKGSVGVIHTLNHICFHPYKT